MPTVEVRQVNKKCPFFMSFGTDGRVPALNVSFKGKCLVHLGSAIPAGDGRCQMLSTSQIRGANLTRIPFLVCCDRTVKCPGTY